MKPFFSRMINFFRRKVNVGRRSYAAAQMGRLTAGWLASQRSADAEARSSLRLLRDRSRELSQNNDYARKFLKMVIANVIGPNGIVLQVKAKDDNGKPDKYANTTIEEGFAAWANKKTASVCGRLSWYDMQRLFAETVARDGEVLVRKVRGFPNKFKFALQFIEADHLDENRNEVLPNGNEIRMGIEFDSWRRPVAYHILVSHPGDYSYVKGAQRYERVPAEEMIHAFIAERPDQSRGIPWMHSAMTRLNMLGGYEEAELVAARVGASQMGFFISETGTEYKGDGVDEEGNIITEADPGTFRQLPKGVTDFKTFDPKHPTGNFGPFMKIMLRGISSGLLVSYNTLASDLEGVNYSSIRQGVLDERDAWRIVQKWACEHFCQEVFEGWLEMALLSGAVNLPFAKFDKFNATKWQPRGWGWVDPVSDVEAAVLSVGNGFKTRTQVVAEQGQDFEEVLEQLAEEKTLAESYGLNLDQSLENKNAKNNQNRKTLSVV